MVVERRLGQDRFRDDRYHLVDNLDQTKQLFFQLSGITTNTTRTLTIPDANGTIALVAQLNDGTVDHGNLSGLSTGSDHSFINQNVTTTGTPTFADLTVKRTNAAAMGITLINSQASGSVDAAAEIEAFTLANGTATMGKIAFLRDGSYSAEIDQDSKLEIYRAINGTNSLVATFDSSGMTVPTTLLVQIGGQMTITGAGISSSTDSIAFSDNNFTGVGTIGSGAITATGTITILNSTPILVFKDSDSLGANSVGYIEWRDKGGGRAGFLGNYTSGNDDLLWKNEQGGNIGIQTTGAGKFQIFANVELNDNSITGVGDITMPGVSLGVPFFSDTATINYGAGNLIHVLDFKSLGDSVVSGFQFSSTSHANVFGLSLDSTTSFLSTAGILSFLSATSADAASLAFTSTNGGMTFTATTGGKEILFDTPLVNIPGEIEQAKSKRTLIGGYAIKLTNKTGSNTIAGQVVKPDDKVDGSGGVDDAFITILANDQEIIGIVLEAGIADGSEAWVVINGIADVLMDTGGSARGDRIISSATVGSGDVWSVGGAVAPHFQEIGKCVEARVGAGLARVVLHFN